MEKDGITSLKESTQELCDDIKRRREFGIGIDINKMVDKYEKELRQIQCPLGYSSFVIQLEIDSYRKGLEKAFEVVWEQIKNSK